MAAAHAAEFTREHGFSAADWQSCLPGAVRGRPWRALGPDGVEVDIGDGRLHLCWQVLAPRRIALICIPRLSVHYAFIGVDAAARQAFMAYFDLYLQRGGG
ncbi:MAG: hypothetical protein AB9M60_22765 [Leptothrix sp. (in: b-proteobacteria)]